MDQREKKRFNSGNIPVYILSLMMLLSILCMPVAAAGSSDDQADINDQRYSLKVNISATDDGSKKGIKDVLVSVCRVASIKFAGTETYYMTEDSFGGGRLDYEKMTASQLNDTAKRYAKIVTQEGFDGELLSVRSDGSGTAVFNDLGQGLYLVVVEKYGSADTGYSETDPFLTSVPDVGADDSPEKWITDVKVRPKSKGGDDPYISDDPPVIKRVEGNNSSKEKFTFELKADNIANPMPYGSREGIKKITIKGSGKSEFGEIEFTEPGTYSYTVRESAGKNKNYSYDKTVYSVKYKIYRSGNELKLEKTVTDGSGKKIANADGYVFVNKYSRSIFSSTAKTGDFFMQIAWLISLIVSFSVIAVIVIQRRILKGQ